MKARVIALHGFQSAPEILDNATTRVANAVEQHSKIQFVFPRGSFPVERKRNQERKEQEQEEVAFEQLQLRSWLPPGKEEGNSVESYRDAFDIVIEEILSCSSSSSRIFFLLGFSQGAIIVQALLAAIFSEKEEDSISKLFEPELKKRLQTVFESCAGIIYGGSPNRIFVNSSSSSSSSSISTEKEGNIILSKFPSLHVLGEKDVLVSNSESLAVYQMSNQNEEKATLFQHAGSHMLPTSAAFVQSVTKFLVENLASKSGLDPEEERNRLQEQLQTLQSAVAEELACVEFALPENSQITSKIVTEERIVLVQASLSLAAQLEEQEEVRKAMGFSENILEARRKKNSKKKHVIEEEEEEHEEEDEDENSNVKNKSSKNNNNSNVLLLIRVPLSYGSSNQQEEEEQEERGSDDQEVPMVDLKNLPPLLQLQPFRKAQLIAETFDVCASISPGSTMLTEICLCVLQNLESWLTSATELVLKIQQSGEEEEEDKDEEQQQEYQEGFSSSSSSIDNKWNVEELDPEETRKIVDEIYHEIETKISKEKKKHPHQSQSKKQQQHHHNDNDGGGGGDDIDENNSSNQESHSSSSSFTIGLLGLPSCGKSSFFNAAVNPQSESATAKVASYTFTTIDPMHGTSFASIPCPCSRLNLTEEECGARYGHHGHIPSSTTAKLRQRRAPVEVVDVAGLVPGAFLGKGRGHAFLNDLVSSSVLVHILDVSGRSTSEGVQLNENSSSSSEGGGGVSPEEIFRIIRAEIHLWIFLNLARRFDVLRRKPQRLALMFSGYHASRSLVSSVLASCGLGSKSALEAKVPVFEQKDLHRLVARFTLARFPTLVVLNKIDVDPAGAKRKAAELQKVFPSAKIVLCSARVETELLKLRKIGVINYVSGAKVFEIQDCWKEKYSLYLSEEKQKRRAKKKAEGGGEEEGFDNNDDNDEGEGLKSVEQMEKILPNLKKFLSKTDFGSGVSQVLKSAISLRPPQLAYLTNDIELKSGGKDLLRDCLLLKSRSKTTDAFRKFCFLNDSIVSHSSSSSSSSSTTSAASSSTYSSSRFATAYSLVRCDCIELPSRAFFHHGDEKENDDEKEGEAEEDQEWILKRTVCKKEQILPAVCILKMIGKK